MFKFCKIDVEPNVANTIEPPTNLNIIYIVKMHYVGDITFDVTLTRRYYFIKPFCTRTVESENVRTTYSTLRNVNSSVDLKVIVNSIAFILIVQYLYFLVHGVPKIYT